MTRCFQPVIRIFSPAQNFVVINGVRWATRNVGFSGTFVSQPEDFGGYFTWNQAQNACPPGWRMPTQAELQSLVNTGSSWITRNGVNGRLFGSVPNQIFLPAAGDICSVGINTSLGAWGCYWSSMPSGTDSARALTFSSDSSAVNNDFIRGFQFSVRCVLE